MHRKLMFVLAIAATLGLAAGALAKTNNLTGKFQGDANSSISLDVKLSAKGKPKKITGGDFAHVDLVCNDGSLAEAEGTLAAMALKKQGSSYSFKLGSLNSDFLLHGTLDKKGKKAEGAVTIVIDQGEHPPCIADNSAFTASK